MENEIKNLLSLKPFQFKSWLESMDIDESLSSNNFNWLLIAEMAGQNATYESNHWDTDNKLLWAEISIFIYQELYRLKAGASPGSDPCIRAAMMIRVSMIKRYGSKSNHYVLDPNHIIKWFFATLKTSPEEVKAQSQEWKAFFSSYSKNNKKLDKSKQRIIENTRELRHLKTRIAMISELCKDENICSNEELEVWTSIKEELP